MSTSPAGDIIWLDNHRQRSVGFERLEYRVKRALYSGSLAIERHRDPTGHIVTRARCEATIAFLKKWNYEILARRFVEKEFRGETLVSQCEGSIGMSPAREWLSTERGLEIHAFDGKSEIAQTIEQLNDAPGLIGSPELLFILNDSLGGSVALKADSFGAWFPLGSRMFAIRLENHGGGEFSGLFARIQPDSSSERNANWRDTICWQKGTKFALTWDAARSAVSSIRTKVQPYGSFELKLMI